MIHYYAKIGRHLIELSSDQHFRLMLLATAEPPELPEGVALVKHDDGTGFIIPAELLQFLNPAYLHQLKDSPDTTPPDVKTIPLEDIPPLE